MNTINITLGLAVAFAPNSAPRGTSAHVLRRSHLFAVVAAMSDILHRGREAAVTRRCAIPLTSTIFCAADSALFAHIGNVVAFTAGRGLAQPAV